MRLLTPLILQSTLAFSSWLPSFRPSGKVSRIPNEPYSGPSVAEFTSGVGKVDGQKIKPWPNETSFEWWYFDVVSTSSANESVVATFYESLPEAFITALNNTFLSASIGGTFKNGTAFSIATEMPTTSILTIDVGLDHVSGVWGDSGFSFRGNGVLEGCAKYTVKIDSPETGVYGTISYRANAPAHYTCGSDLTFSSELIIPNIGWANAIPNAAAVVDLWIQGEHVSFEGTGYHDKNWGDKPFTEAVSSWYWGHAELGPYSVVWFDAIAADGEEYVSGYVAKDGKVLQSSCNSRAVKVRPYGGNDQYPPIVSMDYPHGLLVEFDLGRAGKLRLRAQADTYLVGIPVYFRFAGKAIGEINGEVLEGKAMAEQFALND